MPYRFKEKKIPFLFYRADNLDCKAGHVRFFTSRPGRGWALYTYNQSNPEFAFHRSWNFGIFCVHHVGPGLSTNPEGWHVTWAQFHIGRVSGGFVVQFLKADTYSTKSKNRNGRKL